MSLFKKLVPMDPVIPEEEMPESDPLEEVPPLAFAEVYPLCNVYTKNQVWAWFKLTYRGDYDLELEPCETWDIGEVPGWYGGSEKYGDPLEVEDMIGPSWCTVPAANGRDHTNRWIAWGLQEGLAPGQPFMLRIDTPEWYQCGGYEYPNEWDVSYSWDIPVRRPWPEARAAKSWDRALTRIRAARAAKDAALIALDRRREHDYKAMVIRTDVYYPGGFYHEMCPPDGLTYRLHTTLGLNGRSLGYGAVLAEGRDDGGHHEIAYERMCQNAIERMPHINRAVLDSIRNKKPLGQSVWERIDLRKGSLFP